MRAEEKRQESESNGLNWAISVLSELTPGRHQFFTQWLKSGNAERSAESKLAFAHRVIHFDQSDMDEPLLPDWLSEQQRHCISMLLGDTDSACFGQLCEGLCILCFKKPAGYNQGRLILLGVELIAAMLADLFPGARLSPAELRTVLQLVTGHTLKDAAINDHVSYETKRSQLKAAFVKTGCGKQSELTSFVLSHILINFSSEDQRRDGENTHEVFYRYHDECLPAKSRRFVVVNDDGSSTRFFDFGSIDGKPVVSPHHIGLVFMTDEEHELFESLGIRLIVPLRNGALGPVDEPLLEEQHMRHAMNGMKTAQSMFAGEKVSILAPLSACFYALQFSAEYPSAVDNLIFVGASYKSTTGISTADRFRANLHGMAMNNRWLMNRLLQYLSQQAEDPVVVKKMFQKSYADSPADLQIIEDDFADPHSAKAFEMKIRHSLISIQHDLYYQARQDWSQIYNVTGNIHFLHGVDDRLHPLSGIQQLVSSLDNATMYPISNAGSFIYRDNTPVFLRIVRDILNR